MPLPGSEAPSLPSFDEVFGKRARAIPGGPGPGGPGDKKPNFLDDILDKLTGKKKAEEERQDKIDTLTGRKHDREWKEKNTKENEKKNEFRPLF